MNNSPGPDSRPSHLETVVDRNPATTSGLTIVGIGASAGGLAAFRLLLQDLPTDTGFAIVVIQHLEPTHPSSLAEILGRATRMPVSEATDNLPVAPNHVYIIPPNSELEISGRVLRLSPRNQAAGLHMPIDHFFRSLAQDCGSRTIGVILSGNGSDGALGLQAVKEAGGVTFAQSASTAEHPGMPQMAEAATSVDFVLPPAQIALELARIARHPHFAVGQPAKPGLPLQAGKDELRKILVVMRDSTGIDFSLYRENTVERRIMRRLALRNISNIEDYITQLKKDPYERSLLQRDLLISVTSFFRDPESFQALSRLVFPAIVQNQSADSVIRIWVPGCATGEEAYSIAMALQEYLTETGTSMPVQIFASDVNEAAIERARSGKYPENIAGDVSPERLARHFTKITGGYQVGKTLREICVFSRHNLIDDPPFARLDLISCRNVLIYLGPVQKNIIPLFHFALKPGRFLMLGRSEAASFDDLFSVVNSESRIYAKKVTARRVHLPDSRASAKRRAGISGKLPDNDPLVRPWDDDLERAVDRILISKHNQSAVLVDESLEVLELRGEAKPFFQLPVGKASLHLLKIVSDTGLYLEIEKLVHEAIGTGECARLTQVPYEFNGGIHEVNLEVTPLFSHQSRALLILLEPAQQVGKRVSPPQESPSDRQIAKLKNEVAEARKRLLSVIEEHQSSDEDAQSATEETLSANEELQSLNEELETAKEELQSTNEELITVNRELESKNRALTESRNFAVAIVKTVRVPLLVLDPEFRIRTVNEAFAEAFRMSPRDIEGQLLCTLGQGTWDIPGLPDLLARVMPAGQSFDHLEVERDFPSIGTRNLVINACRLDDLALILVTIDDVTIQKSADKALLKSQAALRQAEKMETIGRLAGGIAHDFNNLLTAIIGYSHLAAATPGIGEALEYIHEIDKASQRAAALTDQLLTFSRRKILQPKIFDLNTVVVDFERMLRRVLGEQIKVTVRAAAGLWHVRADPAEIGRVLMNLCLNARDAMPAGGTLTIQTENLELSQDEAPSHELAAGQYVELSVRDTGIGMDAETRAHVFEPFFTTKETGKGTGLGLAMVFGIVEQSGGSIRCHSELGEGTRFKILLPAVAMSSFNADRPAPSLAEAPRGSAEVILLVEDEDQLRKLAGKILRGRGYIVLEAHDGREALSISDAHQGSIDLLVSDVVMPELGGRELAERIRVKRPTIKLLFMSGHTQDVVLTEGIKSGRPFLQKPFAPSELAHKVRAILDARA